METPNFDDRERDEPIGELEAEPKPTPQLPYNEAANGGRWWEDDKDK